MPASHRGFEPDQREFSGVAHPAEDCYLQGDAAVFPRPLRREIAILLALKAMLLVALYVAFFMPQEKSPVVPLQQHLLRN